MTHDAKPTDTELVFDEAEVGKYILSRLESTNHKDLQTSEFQMCMFAARFQFDKTKPELEVLRAENAELKAELMFNESLTEREDIEFAQIFSAARMSYRNFQGKIRGQTITKADSFDSHLVWAAQAFEYHKLQSKLSAANAQMEKMAEVLSLISSTSEFNCEIGESNQRAAAINTLAQYQQFKKESASE